MGLFKWILGVLEITDSFGFMGLLSMFEEGVEDSSCLCAVVGI